MPTTINATVPKKDNAKVQGEYNFGDNLEEAVSLFGEDVVYSNFLDKVIISAQAVLRRAVEKDKDPAAALAAWKPGVRSANGSGGSKTPKALRELLAMSEEERNAEIERLKKEYNL